MRRSLRSYPNRKSRPTYRQATTGTVEVTTKSTLKSNVAFRVTKCYFQPSRIKNTGRPTSGRISFCIARTALREYRLNHQLLND
jgi:hypothetical protein